MTIRIKDLQSEAETLFANKNALPRSFDAWTESEAELTHTHIYESRAEPPMCNHQVQRSEGRKSVLFAATVAALKQMK
jgi:hypothetical protein